MILNVFCPPLPRLSSRLSVRWKTVSSIWRYARNAEIPRDPERSSVFIFPRVPLNGNLRRRGCDNSSRIIAFARNWRLALRANTDITIDWVRTDITRPSASKWTDRLLYANNRLGEKAEINKEKIQRLFLSHLCHNDIRCVMEWRFWLHLFFFIRKRWYSFFCSSYVFSKSRASNCVYIYVYNSFHASKRDGGSFHIKRSESRALYHSPFSFGFLWMEIEKSFTILFTKQLF